MKAIRLRNVRSLEDTGDISIKPITLLLGQNSSGKSTVLRTLPLLVQSLRTRSNAPVLWYGDLVDFGSVREVRSTFASNDPVEIELNLGQLRTNRGPYYYYEGRPDDHKANVRFSLSLIDVDGKTRLAGFSIDCDDDRIEIQVDGRGTATRVLVNGEDYTRFLATEKLRFVTSELVPQLILKGPPDAPRRSPYYSSQRRIVEAAEREISRFLTEKLWSRIRETTVQSLSYRISYRPGKFFHESLRDASAGLKTMQALSAHLATSDGQDDFERLRAYYMIWSLPEILMSIDRAVSQTFSGVSYVSPSRATGERYYRMQELAVDQIDPQGRNLAMFLHSLSAGQQRQFSEWLLEAIGYAIQVEKSAGHIQLQLRQESSERFYNIADMGYGFSQVLPIMAQVWSRQARTSGPATPIIVAIEQPELHLHPAYQARLADVFARSVSKKTSGSRVTGDVRFVIETHSEALINRIGEMIYEKQVSATDVALYVFEKAVDTERTKIRTVTFEDDGTLSNWPVGFFTAIV